MKNTNLFAIFLMLLLSACLPAAGQEMQERQSAINVNERYVVESIALSGIDQSRVGKPWHQEARKLVGEKYNEKAAQELAARLGADLRGKYKVEVKVERGTKPDHVKVVFHLEKIRRYFHRNAFDAAIPLVVYHSKQGFSGTLEIPVEIHHNVFTFGILSDADQLLERNAGIRCAMSTGNWERTSCT